MKYLSTKNSQDISKSTLKALFSMLEFTEEEQVECAVKSESGGWGNVFWGA